MGIAVHPAIAPEATTPPPVVSVAVVGCGYWGPNLVRNFFDVPGCRMAAICDLSETRLDNLQRRHPSLRTTTSFEDVLSDDSIDAVAIATPVASHYPLAKRALEAGKHVLLEKPLTPSTEDAEELVRIARERDLRLMVDHTFVYTGAVQRIKQLIDSGEIGNLYYYDSVRINLGLVQHDVSVLWDLASHDLAIMDYLLDTTPIGVSATGARHFNGHADVAYLTVRFPDDLIAHFHVNWLSPVKVRRTLIGGDRRMVLFDDIEPTEKVKLYDRGVQWGENPEEDRRHRLVAYRLGDMHAPAIDQTEALKNECQHFIHCIQTGEQPVTDGEAGLRVVRLLEAAERSLANQGTFEPV